MDRKFDTVSPQFRREAAAYVRTVHVQFCWDRESLDNLANMVSTSVDVSHE